jgi:hypothetical protein
MISIALREIYLCRLFFIDLEKVAVHWAAMTTPSIQYNIIQFLIKSASSQSSSYLKRLGAPRFRPNPLPPSVLQWNHEGGNFLSEYDRSNWLFYVGYYLEVSSPLIW